MTSDLLTDSAFIDVQGLCAARVFLKIEALNPAGSIKIKAARGMISALALAGRTGPQTRLIGSSSGNLGVALAMICAPKGIPFTCALDLNTSESNRKTIKALGAEVGISLSTTARTPKSLPQRPAGEY
ncbi:pyridoxal-phosphate dependent enzyme (plasmid) [Thioclava litoralis]|uniref:Pyridoxal-phosphate dependent enzyme n=1 Tax=Thioclava litoralis TaxID=3076557 RepID=A0ABZ1E655_9RHOB|nr:pyridoxal-phosphate dependent enzyme [Thioclava sp. FTW29]